MIFLLDDLDSVPATKHLMMADLDGAIAHMRFEAEGRSGLIFCDAQSLAMPRYLKTDKGRVRFGSSFIVLWDEPLPDPVAGVNYLLDLKS